MGCLFVTRAVRSAVPDSPRREPTIRSSYPCIPARGGFGSPRLLAWRERPPGLTDGNHGWQIFRESEFLPRPAGHGASCWRHGRLIGSANRRRASLLSLARRHMMQGSQLEAGRLETRNTCIGTLQYGGSAKPPRRAVSARPESRQDQPRARRTGTTCQGRQFYVDCGARTLDSDASLSSEGTGCVLRSRTGRASQTRLDPGSTCGT